MHEKCDVCFNENRYSKILLSFWFIKYVSILIKYCFFIWYIKYVALLIQGKLAIPNQTPMQMNYWLFDYYFDTIGNVCAINVFNESYRPNLLTLIYIASINSFFLFFLWMLGHNDVVSILQCVSCLNFCFHVSI